MEGLAPRVPAAVLWVVLASVGGGGGCDPAEPSHPGPGRPVLEGIVPSSGHPAESPLVVVIRGRNLAGAQVEGPPYLFLDPQQVGDHELRLRVGFKGSPPGPAWIGVRTPHGRDSISFRVESLAWGDSLSETRALWVSRFEFATPQDLTRILSRAAEAGFNLVYLQVRGRADAFYRSRHEPWAAELTGTLGLDPGWDPLEVALREAALRGVEVHAWINAFTGWSGTSPPPPSQPRHAFLDHPDWVMVHRSGEPMPYSSGTRWLTPGHPGVRARLGAVAADILRHYAVGGIHLDFVRYPGTDYSWDAPSLAAYDSMKMAEPALDFAEARRRFVSRAVAEVRDSMRAVGLRRELSAAVWGVYQNPLGWSGVSTGYESVLQDARAWDRAGLVDALVPMVYWPLGEKYADRLDFAWLADDHVRGNRGPVFIGIYVPGMDGRKLALHVERARMAGAAGVALFSYSALEDQRLWDALRAWAFHWPARRRG